MTGELKWSGKVHPVADLFPMMTDEELNDLGADIKANGLLHAIVLDGNGDLIDGRNRMEGCRRGEVPPTFVALGERDPVALILSANVTRRHLSKGQQAMAVAKALLLSNTSKSDLSRQTGINRTRIAQAGIVLEYAPDLADSVLLGATPLNEAYEEARHRKQEAQERAEAAKSEQERFERLQADEPDLAAMVQEERLTLNEALAAVQERKVQRQRQQQEERDRLRVRAKNFSTAMLYLDPFNIPGEEFASGFLAVTDDLLDAPADLSPQRARRCAEILLRYADLKENHAA
jgi:RNase H-fold protein (predicted Holliday junction resolvase)